MALGISISRYDHSTIVMKMETRVFVVDIKFISGSSKLLVRVSGCSCTRPSALLCRVRASRAMLASRSTMPVRLRYYRPSGAEA
jgi:hypothetical protein